MEERAIPVKFEDLSKPVVEPEIRTEADLVRKEKRDVTRRNFLTIAAATAASIGMSSDAFAQAFRDRYNPDAPPTRYPEPDVIPLDKRFKYKLGNTTIRRHYRGTLWAEGVAWCGSGRYLVWSDIPRNEALRFLEEDEHVSRQFRYPSGNSNGNTFDYQGRQIAFCHGTRQVVRYENTGTMTVLASEYNGKEFNAPNDGAVNALDHSLFFTDPGYGSLMNYEGNRLPESKGSASPIQKEAVYRISADGKLTKLTDECWKPNGLCFSPDFKKCYVADTGASHYGDKGAKMEILVWDVNGDKLTNRKVFASTEYNGKTGAADGIRADEDGNIWAGMGWVGDGYDGVHIFAPNGDRIGFIRMPEIIGNITFGGSKRNQLFMAGSQSLYSVIVETKGAHIA
jgi:gluconolactonase